jgi:hypothetical protein
MNSKITSIHLPLQINPSSITIKINSRVSTIIKQFQRYDNNTIQTIIAIKAILSIIPNSNEKYEQEFINFQSNIHFFISSLFPNVLTKIYDNSRRKEAWRSTHL